MTIIISNDKIRRNKDEQVKEGRRFKWYTLENTTN